MEPNPFQGWFLGHLVEWLVVGVAAALGFLGRRVVRTHDEQHKELNERLAVLEAVRPVTVEYMDEKLGELKESQTADMRYGYDLVSKRVEDMQKTQTTILETLLTQSRGSR